MDNSINMYDLVFCITNTGDFVENEISKHHKKVAYLSFRIAEKLKLSKESQKEIFLAGLLHDIGAFSIKERFNLIETEDPNINNHAFIGAKIIESFKPLQKAANIMRYHHIQWKDGKGLRFQDSIVPFESHIVHLADRIVVMIDPKIDIFDQRKSITERIAANINNIHCPEIIDAFIELSELEYIWLDLEYSPLMEIAPSLMKFDAVDIDLDQIINLSKIFASIIDFRSPFTANHSSGVAAVAEKLAALCGFSEAERKMMLIAGYLHDLGKLAVENNILEKQGLLDKQEYRIIRSHTFYTFRTLQVIKGFETINEWASYHHEHLDGSGYPFHLDSKSIPLGSRIMAIADIFTALNEDRPYRSGVEKEKLLI